MRTLLAVALRSHLINEPTPVSAKVWRALRPVVADAADGDVVLNWTRRFLPPAESDRVRARLSLVSRVERSLTRLARIGVRAVSEFDPEYPQRFHETLGDRKPEVLFVAGEPSLLNGRSIGIVGSRDADEEGRRFAQAVAEEAVRGGYLVVSGAARGIDQVAMNAARQVGGCSLGFLADSLVRRISREEADVMDGGFVCLATCHKPDAAFSVGNALRRNKLIYCHADATVVVSATRGSGGTWAGATEACTAGRTVFVRSGHDVPEGNIALLENGNLFGKGAKPIEAPEQLLSLLEELKVSQTGV